MQQVKFKTQMPVFKTEAEDSQDDIEVEYKNGDSYTGAITKGNREGEGTYTFKNGDMYVGGFARGAFDGKGTYTTEGGDTYEGTFLDGRITGQGVATYSSIPNFQSYAGFWVDNLASGKGKLTFDLGDYYEGQFENGRFNGKGIMFYTNGDVYDGTYVDGNPQGDGQFMFKESNVVQRRRFANGVDRATTSDLNSSTYEIKKANNVKVKEFKQAANKKFFVPKPKNKVNNSGLVGNLLKSIGSNVKPQKTQKTKKAAEKVDKKAAKNKKVIAVKKKKTDSKQKPQKVKVSSLKKKKTGRKPKVPATWSDYGYKYPNAIPRGSVDTSKLFEEIEHEGPLKNSRSFSATLESAKRFFYQQASIKALTGNVPTSDSN